MICCPRKILYSGFTHVTASATQETVIVLPAPILHHQHKIPVKYVTVTPGYTPREYTDDVRCARCSPEAMKWKGRDEKTPNRGIFATLILDSAKERWPMRRHVM